MTQRRDQRAEGRDNYLTESKNSALTFSIWYLVFFLGYNFRTHVEHLVSMSEMEAGHLVAVMQPGKPRAECNDSICFVPS